MNTLSFTSALCLIALVPRVALADGERPGDASGPSADGEAADAQATDEHDADASESDVPPPEEGDEEEARHQFNRGIELYREGDFSAALFAFKSAYRHSPNYRVLFNIGVSHVALHDYAAAFTALERYIGAAGDEIPPERRATVEQEIERLRPRIGQVIISTNVPGAEISLDGVLLGASPLGEPRLVNIGQREITASARGWHTARQTVEVAGDDVHRVVLELERQPVVRASQNRDLSGGWEGAAFWTSATITVALGAAAVVTGVLTNSADGDLSSELNTFPGDSAAIADARDRVETLALVTDVLSGAAIVAAGTAVTVAVLWANSGDDEEADLVELQLSPVGLRLRSRF